MPPLTIPPPQFTLADPDFVLLLYGLACLAVLVGSYLGLRRFLDA